MAVFHDQNAELYYEFSGRGDAPVIVFVNGLTQRVAHWKIYQEYFTRQGFRVLLFDLMGQGQSVKPTLFIDFRDNQRLLSKLLTHLNVQQVYLAGISFGGVVALRFAIEFPAQVKGIIPMSTFSEMDEHLKSIGGNLYEGMVNLGFEYLVKLFLPFNYSSQWIKNNEKRVPVAVRESFNFNDLYSIQNMMDSLHSFENFTPDLAKIMVPTLILNGEFDYLTSRTPHEIIRQNIKNSKLVIMQKVCHAFTLEIPEITCRILHLFMTEVESGTWKGDQSVWIATDDPASQTLLYPCEGDHMRAIPVPKNKKAE